MHSVSPQRRLPRGGNAAPRCKIVRREHHAVFRVQLPLAPAHQLDNVRQVVAGRESLLDVQQRWQHKVMGRRVESMHQHIHQGARRPGSVLRRVHEKRQVLALVGEELHL